MVAAETGPAGGFRSRQVRIPSALMRGGTSKCWIFDSAEMPTGSHEREQLLSAAFGGADARQINGIGGGTSTTSKAIIVEGVDRQSRRVDYSFAQVSIDRERVEWSSNCGNCATAVALFAVQCGLVEPTGEETALCIRNVQTGLLLEAEVATPGAQPTNLIGADGGVQHLGVPVSLVFKPPTWTTYESLLPTGRAVDLLELDGATFRATLIDAGAPAVLISAGDMGLTGHEDAATVSARMSEFARLRRKGAQLMGLPPDGVAVPKVGVVATSTEGGSDLAARMISMTAPHPSIGLTSAVAIAAAAGMAGSVVHSDLPRLADASGRQSLRIATLAGPIEVEVDLPGPTAVRIRRSARRLVTGSVFVPMREPAEPV